MSFFNTLIIVLRHGSPWPLFGRLLVTSIALKDLLKITLATIISMITSNYPHLVFCELCHNQTRHHPWNHFQSHCHNYFIDYPSRSSASQDSSSRDCSHNVVANTTNEKRITRKPTPASPP
ncbi:predicted protein [Plenodomus lingam JN3]|uniref:Predicted protein n=1 Tax=Leptosphaeria maculans (strain JN3 / isolate v23.1.3 / race Av1-4-5-6-7-8) TaxID=985895 RepID=E4ZRA8_LEPMJ|nr:predicted protein [Plenodomus lingam JN3]CBX93773.1 predicted protein [Plenodomus lingam JN3]